MSITEIVDRDVIVVDELGVQAVTEAPAQPIALAEKASQIAIVETSSPILLADGITEIINLTVAEGSILTVEQVPDTVVVTSLEEVTALITIETKVALQEVSLGLQGPVGPQGASGDLTYVHNQLSPDTVWTVNHNLSKFPSIQIKDSGGNMLYGAISHISLNQSRVTFSTSFGGTAYVN